MLKITNKYFTFCIALFSTICGKNLNEFYQSIILFFVLAMFYLLSNLLLQIKNKVSPPKIKTSFVKNLFKKIGYVFIILIALCMNYAICNIFPFLGITVSDSGTLVIAVITWINLSQMLDCLDNAKQFGVSIPAFFKKMLNDWKNTINKNDE